jgi:hypothetical protein
MGDALGKMSNLGGFDGPKNPTKTASTQAEIKRNPVAVREARLELIREAIFENLGGARLFIETAQLLIEARDDTGMAHAIKMGAHHYRAAVLLAKDITRPQSGGPAVIDMHAVYDGQTFVGSISKDAEGFAAFDTGGKKLGVFPTRTEAVRAVLAPPMTPIAITPDIFDADRALLHAIEALTNGGAR